MLDAIVQILAGVLKFLGILTGGPSAKKVEEILPEESESEKALKKLNGAG